MTKKELGIKKLKYPFWFEVLFFCLTVLAPIALIILEGLKAPNTLAGTAFKLSFMTICTFIIVWFFLKKFLIDKRADKLRARQVALEHDYSIDNGNSAKIKYHWYNNEIKLALFNAFTVILYGGLAVVILMGVASALMKIKGILLLVIILYVVAYTFKFMILIIRKGFDDEWQNV